MDKLKYIVALFMLVIVTSCSSSLKTNKASSASYSEDISSYLPNDPVDSSAIVAKEDVNVHFDSSLVITERLDSALLIVSNYNNAKTTYIEGLTIQLYAGIDRTSAKEVQMRAFRHFPESKPRIIFDQPNYKVRMETFYSQLEAYPVFKSVQSKFSKAILVPTRVPVSKK